MEKINCWVLLGYRTHVMRPGIYWIKSKYFSNVIRDNNKYTLNGIIYEEDYDNYDDYNNPIYISYGAEDEHRLMMIIKNGTDMNSSEIYRTEQNKIEENKNKIYFNSINPDDLDIC